jgi:hypothetical protein
MIALLIFNLVLKTVPRKSLGNGLRSRKRVESARRWAMRLTLKDCHQDGEPHKRSDSGGTDDDSVFQLLRHGCLFGRHVKTMDHAKLGR